MLGFDVARQPLEARRQMAVVLQQTAAENLLTVRDNLLIYAYLHGVARSIAEKRMKAVVEEFELGGRLRDTVQELSIGTKRRIQVAKIFMLDLPIIILDEATTGMDPLMKRRVMDRLRAEARSGRTILLTTQVLSEAEELCETIMIINQGRTMASGTLQELRKRAAHMFRVSLSFARRPTANWSARLEALKPLELLGERQCGRDGVPRRGGVAAREAGRHLARHADPAVRGARSDARGNFRDAGGGFDMKAITAVFYRDYRQRMTNIGFVFWDLFVPLAYLLLFGLGFERMIGGGSSVIGDQIPVTLAFLLPGVLAMVTFTVAMNTSWGFFMDKDSGIFYELLTYPITRPQFLIGKIGFNVLLSVIGSLLAIVVGVVALDIGIRWDLLPLTA